MVVKADLEYLRTFVPPSTKLEASPMTLPTPSGFNLPELPAYEQVARWQAEARRLWPDYQLQLSFRETSEGLQYSLHLTPLPTAPAGKITPLIPTTPTWQPIELFWSQGTSYLEFLLKQFPDQNSLVFPQQSISQPTRQRNQRWISLPLAVAGVAAGLVYWGVPVPSIRFVPLPGVTTARQPAAINLSNTKAEKVLHTDGCVVNRKGICTSPYISKTWVINGQRVTITEPVQQDAE